MNNDTTRQSSQVEVTPEMEEAGFQVLRKSAIADAYLVEDRLLVAEIYRAMYACRQAQAPE
jgi:hypothetical protein